MLHALLMSMASFLPSDTCKDLFVPNVISPNSEVGGTFGISTTCLFSEFSLQLFDRWGNRVFETQDPAFDLDITDYRSSEGNPIKAGTYMYLIEGKMRESENSVSYKGSVTFIN